MTTRLPVENPATLAHVGEAPSFDRVMLDAAVTSARAALPGWSATPFDARGEILQAMADAVDKIAEDVAALLTAEQGKPIAEARREVSRVGQWFRGTATLDAPAIRRDRGDGRICETRYLPLGVVAAIAPWNYPLLLAAFKLAPALLAGNVVILKPSPYTPLSTLVVFEAVQAFLPPGVLTVATGDDALGPWLTSHPGIDKVSFTGSTATGRRVMAAAAPTLKRVTLELGGNDAAIVLDDADLDAIAGPLFWSAFRNAGQVCVATKRLYVQRRLYRPLVEAMIEKARAVTLGDGADPAVLMGPTNNAAQQARVNGLIDDAKARGARVETGGNDCSLPGYFVQPSIVTDIDEDARIVQEEQFGPVLPILPFDDVDDAIERANRTDFALGASIWSSDVGRARRIAGRMIAGGVWVNESGALSPTVPFGGLRQSGVGVEGGEEGLLGYMQLQTLT